MDSLIFNWPQIAWAIGAGLGFAFSVCSSIYKDNAAGVFAAFVAYGFSCWLLYQGGFFMGVRP